MRRAALNLNFTFICRKATKKFEKRTKQKPKAHDKKERKKETTMTIIVGGGVEEEGEEDDFVPTVSLTLYETDFDQFVNKLGEAYEKYGFVILENHGVAQTDIERAFRLSKSFFEDLSQEEKEKYHLPGKGGARGFTAFGRETAKGATKSDLKEFWHQGRDLPTKGHKFEKFMPPNVEVNEIEGFTESAKHIFYSLDELGNRVLQALAVYLKQDRHFFDDKVDEGNSILRIIHYPPIAEESAGHVRAGAHEDINLITLLLGADEGGLQILRKDGKWLDVNPAPGCVTCNIGDMLQRLTNHVLPSTTHRVVNPPKERAHIPRFSMPYFLHPNPDYVIDTLESCVSEDRPNRYPEPISSDDYLQERLKEIKLK
jgi:isopenicillin N synthase-like dioxygenase